MGIPFGYVLALAGIVVLLGMICATARRNLIMILLGVEVMLNGAAIAFIGASLRWQHLEGRPSCCLSSPSPRPRCPWGWP